MSSDDKLIIETPEQTALEFPLAGIGSRSLALAIDTLLQIGVLIVLGILAGIISVAGFFPQYGKQWTYAILILAAFLSQFGYFAFFEAVWNGRTPGKRWTHLRVITDSGRPIGTQEAILRNLMRIVDYLPSIYAVGIITSLISPQNKRVGDYLAGTVVIHEKSAEGGHAIWNSPAPQMSAAPLSRTLSLAELQLVEAFLERRPNLQQDVRRNMARQIAERLDHGSPANIAAPHEPEKFLEMLADQSRNVARFR
jgi:uncharacterized RDD family membrane protein YckC